MSTQDNIQRSILPIPDQPHVGLTTYDVKDPDTKYPPIRELRPPTGAASPYLLHNHSIWKSLEDNREEKIGKDLRGWKKRIVSEDDWGWVLNPVILQSIKNRSMGPHFGGGGSILRP